MTTDTVAQQIRARFRQAIALSARMRIDVTFFVAGHQVVVSPDGNTTPTLAAVIAAVVEGKVGK
jgi:hypothetical protein